MNLTVSAPLGKFWSWMVSVLPLSSVLLMVGNDVWAWAGTARASSNVRHRQK